MLVLDCWNYLVLAGPSLSDQRKAVQNSAMRPKPMARSAATLFEEASPDRSKHHAIDTRFPHWTDRRLPECMFTGAKGSLPQLK
jgi:hypothetical protein